MTKTFGENIKISNVNKENNERFFSLEIMSSQGRAMVNNVGLKQIAFRGKGRVINVKRIDT